MHAEEIAKAILALPRKQLLLVARAHNEVKPRGEKKSTAGLLNIHIVFTNQSFNFPKHVVVECGS